MINPSAVRRSLILVALLAAFMSQASWALAGTSGNMGGIITDASTGAPLAGVRLEISSGSQTVTTTTDAHGHYSVLFLQPDDYTLTAQKQGYATRSVSGFSVYADQTQQFDLQLDPANTSGS
jgi:hypothetical protein